MGGPLIYGVASAECMQAMMAASESGEPCVFIHVHVVFVCRTPELARMGRESLMPFCRCCLL